MSVDDQIKLAAHQLENNLTTGWQLLQRHNKDLTNAQAKKIIEENREENNANKPEEPKGPQGAFSRLRQGAPEPQQNQ